MLGYCWAEFVDGGPVLTPHWVNVLAGNMHIVQYAQIKDILQMYITL